MKEHKYQDADCPKCGAENTVMFIDGKALADGSVVDKSYMCFECNNWLYNSDFKEGEA